MSSISNRPNGHKWISYQYNSKRHTVRLGVCGLDLATEFQKKLDRLIQCRQLGSQLDAELTAWLFNIGDNLHRSLVQSGLATSRGPSNLCDLIKAHDEGLVARKARESTLCNNRVLHANLRKFFGPRKRLDSITVQDAEKFLRHMREEGGKNGGPLAEATVSNRIKRARAVFAYGIKNNWITSNPFAHIRTGSEVNSDRDCYIPIDFFEKIIDRTADKELRFLLALVRFCGLRCPSEVTSLTWPAIDWMSSSIVINSPKTGRREIPVFKALHEYLYEHREAAPVGEPLIFPRHQGTGTAIVNRLEDICRKAGEALWPKPMNNMRASAERDMLAAGYDIAQVATWMGHSPTIALKHYNRVSKERVARQAAGALRVDLVAADAKRKAMYSQEPLRSE